ncbi:MAG: uracil-DNA glycosylase family protein [Desulfurococcaceae archaeon]
MDPEIEKLIREISECSRCGRFVIDKPCLIHDIYRKFMPPKPRALVISESPPPGPKKDYLYNIGEYDRLRQALAKTFEIPENEVINYLYNKHVFWTTAIKCRPISEKQLEAMGIKINFREKFLETLRINCRKLLDLEIKIIKPNVIVALGTKAKKSLIELNLKPHLSCYHPLYYSRRGELNKLRSILEKSFEIIGQNYGSTN